MKNKILFLAASLAILCNATMSVNAAPQKNENTLKAATYLTIYNNWNKPVHVKEGRISKTDEDLYPNRAISMAMSSGFVTNLSISYKKDGQWQEIPGCPAGSFYRSVRVFVTFSDWDPNTPICTQA